MKNERQAQIEKINRLEVSFENMKKTKDTELQALKDKLTFFEQNFANKIESPRNSSTMFNMSREEFLLKKFNAGKYLQQYIIETLNQDVLDFKEYTKNEVSKMMPKYNSLFKQLAKDITEVTGGDFEAILFGSHSTGLCLQWSDLDLVLRQRKNIGLDSKKVLSKIENFLRVIF